MHYGGVSGEAVVVQALDVVALIAVAGSCETSARRLQDLTHTRRYTNASVSSLWTTFNRKVIRTVRRFSLIT